METDPYTLVERSEGRALDEAVARRLVDSQFPQWAHLPIKAVDLNGWDNRSFRLGSSGAER